MIVTEAAIPLLGVALGATQKDVIPVGMPVLRGPPVETIFRHTRAAGRAGPLALFETEGWLMGGATVPVTAGLEATVHDIYLDLLRAAQRHHLARIWNYVPAINATGPAGLENYRAFCRGRSLAFEQHHGASFQSFLPAASAVGCAAGMLTVVFAAAPVAPRHVENPLQMPAYEYPDDYGPRAPSFARATVVPVPGGSSIFISGTSAIRGHATVAPHRTGEQLACTLENLRSISLACGLGMDLGTNGPWMRHFKIYLRQVSDLPLVSATLNENLLRRSDIVSYLHADICRAALNVEIETTLRPLPAI